MRLYSSDASSLYTTEDVTMRGFELDWSRCNNEAFQVALFPSAKPSAPEALSLQLHTDRQDYQYTWTGGYWLGSFW